MSDIGTTKPDKLGAENHQLQIHLRNVLVQYKNLLSRANGYEAYHLGVFVTNEAKEVADARWFLEGNR